MPRRFRLVLLLAGSVAASVATAETLVRVFLPQPKSWMAIYRAHPEKPMFGVEANIDEIADTGETRWRVRTDEHGLRLRGDGTRLGTGAQVALLGDSFTFGYGVDHDISFAGLLEQGCADRARVINAGQPGYGPEQALMLLQHMLAVGFQPTDVILVVYAGNDVLDAILPTSRPVVNRSIDEPPGWRERVQQHSHLYRVVARAYHRWFQRSPHFVHDWQELMRPATWEQPDLVKGKANMRQSITALRDLCREHDARLYTAVLPPTAAVDAYAHTLEHPLPELQYDLPVQQMLRLLSELELPVLDLTPSLAPLGSNRAFLPFDGHLSMAGHAAVAAALREALPILRE